MEAQYVGILALVAVAAILCGAMVTFSWLFGPKKVTPYKQSSYECGVEPIGDVHERFPIKFYLIAILFIMFDIEVVFLWSWFTVYRNSGPEFMVFSFFEFIGYMATWVVGYIYAIRVGAIDWDESTVLPVERLAANEASVLEPVATGGLS
jgi:NADH-quinone oxidoreductase subunit A